MPTHNCVWRRGDFSRTNGEDDDDVPFSGGGSDCMHNLCTVCGRPGIYGYLWNNSAMQQYDVALENRRLWAIAHGRPPFHRVREMGDAGILFMNTNCVYFMNDDHSRSRQTIQVYLFLFKKKQNGIQREYVLANELNNLF